MIAFRSAEGKRCWSARGFFEQDAGSSGGRVIFTANVNAAGWLHHRHHQIKRLSSPATTPNIQVAVVANTSQMMEKRLPRRAGLRPQRRCAGTFHPLPGGGRCQRPPRGERSRCNANRRNDNPGNAGSDHRLIAICRQTSSKREVDGTWNRDLPGSGDEYSGRAAKRKDMFVDEDAARSALPDAEGILRQQCGQ